MCVWHSQYWVVSRTKSLIKEILCYCFVLNLNLFLAYFLDSPMSNPQSFQASNFESFKIMCLDHNLLLMMVIQMSWVDCCRWSSIQGRPQIDQIHVDWVTIETEWEGILWMYWCTKILIIDSFKKIAFFHVVKGETIWKERDIKFGTNTSYLFQNMLQKFGLRSLKWQNYFTAEMEWFWDA